MVQMISGPDALAMIQSYDVAVVDVRNPEQYTARHFIQDGIEAINARTEEQLLSLPKKRILVYCTCTHDGLAIKKSQFLVDNGYEWVWTVQGGLYALLNEVPFDITSVPQAPAIEEGREPRTVAIDPRQFVSAMPKPPGMRTKLGMD